MTTHLDLDPSTVDEARAALTLAATLAAALEREGDEMSPSERRVMARAIRHQVGRALAATPEPSTLTG